MHSNLLKRAVSYNPLIALPVLEVIVITFLKLK